MTQVPTDQMLVNRHYIEYGKRRTTEYLLQYIRQSCCVSNISAFYFRVVFIYINIYIFIYLIVRVWNIFREEHRLGVILVTDQLNAQILVL